MLIDAIPAPSLALETWRRNATNTVLLFAVLAQLPVLVLMFTQRDLPLPAPLNTGLLVTYLINLFGALARGSDHRVRIWLSVSGGYLCALIGAMVVPQGPYVRALPIMMAILVLVLIGTRPARIATAISAGIILVAPLLGHLAMLERLGLGRHPAQHVPIGASLLQSVALLVMLTSVMVLLELFHRAFRSSLVAQQHALEALQHESAQRATAVQTLEREARERRRLEQELTRISEEERCALGRDVHDGICQQLTGARLRCQALARRAASGAVLPPDEVQALSALLEDAFTEAYHLAQGLHPVDADPDALANALHLLAARTHATTRVTCRFRVEGTEPQAPQTVATHLFRIAQEAVSNAVRHAGAEHITITLHGDAQAITLHIADDGRGLGVTPSATGMGMRTMTYRAQALEGQLTVDSPPAGGVVVTCRIPRPVVRGVADA